jgi:nicotinamidase-related amidase
MRVNDRYVSFYYELDDDIGEVVIDPKKTALLVIDMQNVFITRPVIENPTELDVLLQKRWEPFYKKIDEVVIPNNKRILEAFRAKGIEVGFAMIQSHKNNGSDRSLVQKATGFNELLLPKGSEDAKIVDELSPIGDEIVITKTTDSAITGTNLRLILHNMGIDTVVVTGVFTDQCVSGTVRSLADESFHVWLIEDACMASTERIQKNELEILNNIYCHVINTDELLEAIK